MIINNLWDPADGNFSKYFLEQGSTDPCKTIYMTNNRTDEICFTLTDLTGQYYFDNPLWSITHKRESFHQQRVNTIPRWAQKNGVRTFRIFLPTNIPKHTNFWLQCHLWPNIPYNVFEFVGDTFESRKDGEATDDRIVMLVYYRWLHLRKSNLVCMEFLRKDFDGVCQSERRIHEWMPEGLL